MPKGKPFLKGDDDGKQIPRAPEPERGNPASERLLARIWADLLKTDPVDVRDSFFELGGDSILSIQLVARAGRAGYQITPRQVFENPVLPDLAAVAVRAEASSIDQGPVRGPLPLTPDPAFTELVGRVRPALAGR